MVQHPRTYHLHCRRRENLKSHGEKIEEEVSWYKVISCVLLTNYHYFYACSLNDLIYIKE
jgi:hypothetical protein